MSNPPQSYSQYPQKAKIDPLLHLKTHNQQQQSPPKKIKKRKKMKVKIVILRVRSIVVIPTLVMI
jgi:hypothetical protein